MTGGAKEAREERRRQREHEARQVVHDIEIDRRARDNRLGLVVLAVAAVIGLVSSLAFAATRPGDDAADAGAPPAATEPLESPAETEPEPERTLPPTMVAEDRTWFGAIEFADGPVLEIEIDGAAAPQAASNLIVLAGTGTGGPGYRFGPLENVPADDVYPAGTIAMARAADPDSMGSQFFIVYEETRLPAPGYTVLGEVTSGLDELRAQIVDAGVAPGSPSPGDGAPAVPVTISTIRLE
ncbi:MAG: peptidylprolyl isomerase [Microbacteriaceae bacterium]|nr:peptidylprolyl isomerase [Microbacteriaceae bacterium]